MAAPEIVDLRPGNNFRTWRVTTGAAAQLAALPVIGVLLRSPATNTTNIQIGYNNAFAANTFGEIAPGQSVSLDISNTGLIFHKAASGTPVLEVWAVLSSAQP